MPPHKRITHREALRIGRPIRNTPKGKVEQPRFSHEDGAFHVVEYQGGEAVRVVSSHPSLADAEEAIRWWLDQGLECGELRVEER